MAENRESTSGFTWFLAGAVCGAVVALLYAPNSGQHMRKLIVRKTDETKDALADGGKEIVEKGKELFDRGRQIAEEAAELFDRGRSSPAAERARQQERDDRRVSIMSALSLGSFRIQLVHVGIQWWDAGGFFGVVPKTMWSKRMTCDDLNRLRFSCNCCLVETGRHTVLIETGIGDRLSPMEISRMNMPGQLPPLPDILAAAGIDVTRIDLVVNTHLHFDHCGGNTLAQDGRFVPAFPRARYVTQRGEWEHAHVRHVRDAVSYRDSNYDPLVESGQMELLSGNTEIVSGIELEVVPGHNHDMMIVRARSGGETFCFFSDLVPSTHHVKPTWVGAVDLFPLTAIDHKTRILTQAAAENWWCAYAHDADVSFSRIRNDRGKLEAVECQP